MKTQMKLLLTLCCAVLLSIACSQPSPSNPTPRLFGAGGTTSPIIPASWTTPAWFIDPANSSGVASDSNSCTSSGAPCLSYAQIAQQRWGTYSPRLQQATSLTWMSTQSGAVDPVYADLLLENGAATIQGQLGAGQLVCSSTLSGVVAKNRATPQLLTAALCAGTSTTGLLVNNTTHSSFAWTYSLVTGTTWTLSQPCAPQTTASTCTEVNTWANGDTYSVYAPVGVNIAHLGPTSGFNQSFGNKLFLYHVRAQDAASGTNFNFNTIAIDRDVSAIESRLDSIVNISSEASGEDLVIANNDYFFVGAISSSPFAPASGFAGSLGLAAGVLGTAQNAFGQSVIQVQGGSADWDTIIGGGASAKPVFNGGFGAVYIDTATVLSPSLGLTINLGNVVTGGVLWGPGTLNATVRSRIAYTNTATTEFLVSALTINGGTTACSIGTGATAVWNCGITLNVANLDAAVGVAGFGGAATIPAGAAFMRLGGI